MANTVFKYTSKDFDSLLNDINSDNTLVDTPNWWKHGICGIGDVIAMWNNALANNLLLRTAYTRRNVQLLLELIDYQMSAHSTASGIILFYVNDNATFPFTVNVSDLVALTTGSLQVSSKRFEARSGITVTAVTDTFTANAVTDLLTVSREFMTGEKVRVTSSGSLPPPLVIDTNYYVIKISATTIKLATSLTNAYNGTAIDITGIGSGTHTLHLYSFQATVYQQQSRDQFVIGESDGTTAWQEFDLNDKYILSDTISVEINSQSYTLVESWIDSVSTDYHFRLFYNTDMTAKIQFGNGDFGIIPPAFDVNVSYSYGGGSISNITVINSISVYGGTDNNIESVSNPSSLTGGDDEQSIENAKILAPILLKSRDRFITEEDGVALTLAYNGIALTKVISNFYGVLSAKVVNIASGGGQLTAQKKSDLQTFLIDKTILEDIDVRVMDAVITAQNTTSAAKLLSGYTWSGGVEDYFRLAWKLFWSEAGYEIKQKYTNYGIEEAVTLINTIFTESFGSSDYSQIIILLDALNPRSFDEDIQESDVVGFIAPNINGLDYMTITAPTFPISLDDDEITTYGTLTLTQIT